MANRFKDLCFYAPAEEIEVEGARNARLSSMMASKSELLSELARALRLPDYFGHNWDALDECLRDFQWIPEKEIILIHDRLPTLSDSELRTYLDILMDAVKERQNDESHHFSVWFPHDTKSRIVELLKDS